jgi:hypothetical protein
MSEEQNNEVVESVAPDAPAPSAEEQRAIARGDYVKPPEPVKEPEAVKESEKAAEPEKAVEPEKERDEKGRFMPLDAHKKTLELERSKRESVERELAELREQMKATQVTEDVAKVQSDIKELNLQFSKLLLDGDHVQAAETMSLIQAKTAALQEQRQAEIVEQVAEQRDEKGRMASAISGLEDAYPMLKEDSEVFDQELTDMVLDQQLVFINRDRMTPSAALLKAADKIMSKLAKTVEVPPTGLSAARTTEDRKATQVAKNIATAKAQPASLKESGMDSDKAGASGVLDAARMTREERAALPEATRARLRGDFV